MVKKIPLSGDAGGTERISLFSGRREVAERVISAVVLLQVNCSSNIVMSQKFIPGFLLLRNENTGVLTLVIVFLMRSLL